MARPVCKTRCNVTPVCGGQWQTQGQGSFTCGQASSGYNPGYGYNPSINLPAQVSTGSSILTKVLISCHRMGSWASTPCPPAALEAAVWVEAVLMEAQEAQG